MFRALSASIELRPAVRSQEVPYVNTSSSIMTNSKVLLAEVIYLDDEVLRNPGGVSFDLVRQTSRPSLFL